VIGYLYAQSAGCCLGCVAGDGDIGVTVLTSALTAEITDYDEELTGQRREGAYYSTLGLLDHVVAGAASALLPILLFFGRSRFDLHGPLGVRLIGVVGGMMMLLHSPYSCAIRFGTLTNEISRGSVESSRLPLVGGFLLAWISGSGKTGVAIAVHVVGALPVSNDLGYGV